MIYSFSASRMPIDFFYFIILQEPIYCRFLRQFSQYHCASKFFELIEIMERDKNENGKEANYG